MAKPIQGTDHSTPRVQIIMSTPCKQLPPELIREIFKCLRVPELATCSSVCKQWNQISQTDFLWQFLLKRDFPLSKNTGKLKENYQHHYFLNTNLEKGIYTIKVLFSKNMKTMFSGMRRSFILTENRRLISENRNGTIKIQDLETNTCLNTLQQNMGAVSSLLLNTDGQRLVLGFFHYGNIKIWDLETNHCLHTLHAHDGKIRSLALSKDEQTLISGFFDGTIQIWDLKTSACKKTLQGNTHHMASMRTIRPLILNNDGQKFISGSYDGTIKIWSLETGDCLDILQGHKGVISFLVPTIDGRKLISGFEDGTVQIWDLAKRICLNTLQGSTLKGDIGAIRSLILTQDGRKFISGAYDGTIRVWNLETGDCLNTLQGHEWIRSLVLTRNGLISGSADGTIQIWNFSASHAVIFQELAEIFKTNDSEKDQTAMERFARMPEQKKQKIYTELCSHGQHLSNEEDLTNQWQNATSEQKALAIEGYLGKSPPPD